MFCYQCGETAKGTGCQKLGVCGKDDFALKPIQTPEEDLAAILG